LVPCFRHPQPVKDRPYRPRPIAALGEDKNRKHPAFSRVLDQFG
jgi:hypothetical protein